MEFVFLRRFYQFQLNFHQRCLSKQNNVSLAAQSKILGFRHPWRLVNAVFSSRKNDCVMLTSQAGSLLGDMMSHQLISIELGFLPQKRQINESADSQQASNYPI